MMSNINQIRLIDLEEHGDNRGQMIVVEGNKGIPFSINRIFYIYGSDRDVVRGQHSNRESEFVLIAVAGSCKVLVKDGISDEKIFNLDTPTKGLYLPTMIWKEMFDFSEDCVLLVLTNTHYNGDEYIRDFHQLQREMLASFQE